MADGQKPGSPVPFLDEILEFERRRFEFAGDTLSFWAVVELCVHFNQEGSMSGFPDWVMRELSRLAIGVDDLYRRQMNSSADSIGAEAAALLKLKPKGQGVRLNAFDYYQLNNRDMQLALEVRRRLRENKGLEDDQACSNVSEDRGVSEAVVCSAWARWRSFFENQNLTSPKS